MVNGCGPEELLWILFGAGLGAMFGIIIMTVILRRWIREGMKGYDGPHRP